MNKLWTNNEQVMRSHEPVMKKSSTSKEQIINKLWTSQIQVMKKERAIYKQAADKSWANINSWMSQEQVINK